MVVVVIQATVLTYLHHPKWKAFMLTLPFPFTAAVLAVGKSVDTTNMLGLLLVLVFTHSVRIFYKTYKMPIIVAIVASALLYCFLAKILSNILPRTPWAFWLATFIVFVVAVSAFYVFSHKNEEGQKSSMPVFFKLIIIIIVVYCIMLLKKSLSGFVTVFPMVGIVAAYEARHALWTLSRQMPILLLTLGSMIAVIFVLQNITGIYWALAAGWGVFTLVLIPFTKHSLKKTKNLGLKFSIRQEQNTQPELEATINS